MALVVTMMALLVLVALTGALLPLASTETAVAANHRPRATQAFYAAEAALEWAVQELQTVGSLDAVLTGRVRSTVWAATAELRLPDGSVLDLRQATAELERVGGGASHAGQGLRWRLYAHGPLRAILPSDPSNGLLFIAVWVADDSAETDGDPLRDTNDTLVVHAAAVGPALAQRAVQATLSRPLTMESPAQDEGGSLVPGLRRLAARSWRLVR